jgi:imidazole glycerol phosphate synthase glutamine amidotransferase subunit
MAALQERGLMDAIRTHIAKGKPFLGICLGMQLLFEGSEEAPKTAGLGILKGNVRRLPAGKDLKIPHMGWNRVRPAPGCVFFRGSTNEPFVYFCHSYYPEPADTSVIAATTEYGVSFASAVWKDNVYGVQFHPEKSQDTGLAMLRNFVEHIRDNDADNPGYRPA